MIMGHKVYAISGRKILTVENIDKFDEFSAIRQYFPHKIFPLVSYLKVLARCLRKLQYPKHTTCTHTIL